MSEAPATAAPAPPETPVHPEILAMEEALDRGDHVATREIASRLSRSDDPKLRDAGAAMLHRLRPDPVILGVLAATAFVMVALALAYLGARS